MFSIYKLKIDKKYLSRIDFPVIIAVALLCLFGITNVFSATKAADHFKYLELQLMWIIIGSILAYLILTTDYKIISNYCYIFYWASIALLIYTRIGGVLINGARCWIRIGSVLIEPAEFAKLSLMILLARKIKDMDGKIHNLKNFSILLFYIAIPLGLIIKLSLP